ncbi:MAG: hypothetical protein F6K26_01435 [Moorea sp. SIO2I5]|nr:hypothetical protein [Moorena sp. SIO2I5]
MEKHSLVKLANEDIKVYKFFDPEQDHCLDAVAHGGNPQDRAASLSSISCRMAKLSCAVLKPSLGSNPLVRVNIKSG